MDQKQLIAHTQPDRLWTLMKISNVADNQELCDVILFAKTGLEYNNA
jgi:hypothetical protein